MAGSSKQLAREMRTIRTSFTRLARSFARIAPLLAVPAAAPESATGSGVARRRPRLTASHRKALKLQGKYMGTMRGLKGTQKSRVKKIREQKGIHAAIREALRLAG